MYIFLPVVNMAMWFSILLIKYLKILNDDTNIWNVKSLFGYLIEEIFFKLTFNFLVGLVALLNEPIISG